MNIQTSYSVPVLITWDVDPAPWYAPDIQRQYLSKALNMCQSHGIRATFFFTARPADVYLEEFENMKVWGHEIGCHGLTHGVEENYDRMPKEMQRAYIREATEKLQTLIGAPIRAFRGPRVKTSACTLRLLADQGYIADSSVCSQRADLMSSNLVNTGWIVAPRRPYQPHRDSAFKRGDIPIWEVPVSAAVVPFISSSLKVLGLSAMKMLFRLLYAESRRTGKPIVYLAHPAELLAKRNSGKVNRWKFIKRQIRRKAYSLSHIRTHGLKIRYLLVRVRGETLVRCTRDLFTYMASFPDVTFMTVSEYAVQYLGDAR